MKVENTQWNNIFSKKKNNSLKFKMTLPLKLPKEINYTEEGVYIPTLADIQKHKDHNGIVLSPDKDFELIDTWSEFESVISEMQQAQCIAVDTETQGLNKMRHKLCGYSFTYRKDYGGFGEGDLRNVYIPVRHRTGDVNLDPRQVAEKFKSIFANKNLTIILWNAKFDIHKLTQEGIDVKGRCIDGSLIHKIIFPGKKSALKFCAVKWIDPKADQSERVLKVYLSIFCSRNKWKKPSQNPLSPSLYDYIPTRMMAPYAARDTFFTWVITHALLQEAKKSSSLLNLVSLEHSLQSILLEIERIGLYIDRHVLKKNLKDLNELCEKARLSALEIFEGNIKLSSPQSVSQAFRDMGMPVVKATRATKNYPPEMQFNSTDEVTLLRLNNMGYPVAGRLLRWKNINNIIKKIQKLTNYIESDSCIHATYKAIGSVSSRIISYEPNSQGLPNKVPFAEYLRTAMRIPENLRGDWIWVFGDLSQVELRITAFLSQEPSMLEAYRKEIDIHETTAKDIFGYRWDSADAEEREKYRTVGKRLNFSILYGAGKHLLSDILFKEGIDLSPDECEKFIDEFKRKRKSVFDWMNSVKDFGYEHGYVENLFGRKRDCRDLQSNELTSEARNKLELGIINHAVQSLAADLYKRSFVKMKYLFDKDDIRYFIVNSVHDEVQLYVHRDSLKASIEILKKSFEEYPKDYIDVPLVLELEYSMDVYTNKKELNEMEVERIICQKGEGI